MPLTISDFEQGSMGDLRYNAGRFQFDSGDSQGIIKTNLTQVTSASVTYGGGTAGTGSPAIDIPDPTKPKEIQLTADIDSGGLFIIWGR